MCINYLLKQWCYIRNHPESQWFKTNKKTTKFGHFSSDQLKIAAIDWAETDSIVVSQRLAWVTWHVSHPPCSVRLHNACPFRHCGWSIRWVRWVKGKHRITLRKLHTVISIHNLSSQIRLSPTSIFSQYKSQGVNLVRTSFYQD